MVAKIPPGTLQQQFKTTNYIGLAMMAAVFLYAVIVLVIDQGYLPYKAPARRQSRHLHHPQVYSPGPGHIALFHYQIFPEILLEISGLSAARGHPHLCLVRSGQYLRPRGLLLNRQCHRLFYFHGHLPVIFLPLLSQICRLGKIVEANKLADLYGILISGRGYNNEMRYLQTR